jgi:hypothetical protein
MKKAKDFQITLNQVNKWDTVSKYLLSLKGLTYLIAGKEKAPTTQHEHIHCYIQFKYSVALSLKKLEGAHIEICKGTPQQNKDYVMKSNNIILQKGMLRPWGGFSITYVKSLTESERENLPFTYYTKLKMLKVDEETKLKASEYYKEVKVKYIYGKSGIGKTKFVKDEIERMYKDKIIENDYFNELKFQNGFWIGISSVNKAEIALYDDFRDNQIPVTEFINFIDYNIHNMNIKNGSVKNTFKYIYITSIQSPYDLYISDFDETKEQWLRRITNIINMEEVNIY